jgi:hypothetical protein
MKTKLFFIAMLVVITAASGYAQVLPTQDVKDGKAPTPSGVLAPTTGYVTTTDNENNSFTGVADGDMDVSIYDTDPRHPIEFNIFTNETVVTSAQLSIFAYDVDWPSGEQDEVFLNGHSCGYLTGTNESWSTTVFNVNPAWIVLGPGGKNVIEIIVDELYNDTWRVIVDWGQIITNASTGTATFRYVTLNKANYCASQCVQVTEEVDAVPDMSVRVETSLLDPSNNSIAQDTRTFTATTGNEAFTTSLCLPSNPPEGTWHIQAIVYDAITNTQEDIRSVPLTVTVSCNVIPTLTEWGLIILGLVLVGFGTIYILKWKGTSA